MLFDFDINKIYNAIPLSLSGLSMDLFKEPISHLKLAIRSIGIIVARVLLTHNLGREAEFSLLRMRPS